MSSMTTQLQGIIVAVAVAASVLWLLRKLWRRRTNPCEMCACSGFAAKLNAPDRTKPAGTHSSSSDGEV